MTKRIFSLIMAIAVMTTMLTAFSLDAYAIGSVYEEAFDDGDYSDGTFSIPSASVVPSSYDSVLRALKISPTGAANFFADFHDFTGATTEKLVIEFDARSNGVVGGIYFSAPNASKCAIIPSGTSRLPVDDEWYHFKLVGSFNGTSTPTFSCVRTKKSTGVTANVTLSYQNKQNYDIRISCSADSAGKTLYIDNLIIYNESALIDGSFKIGTTPVTAAAQITAGDLVATANVAAVVAKSGLEKFMVAFDKTGKMLDVVTASQALTANATTAVTATMTLDAAKAAAIADEGYVGFYLWDGMYPEVKALELK